MEKTKIAFMAPKTKGGPYFIYKEITERIKENYGDQIDCHLYNTSKEYLKLHFRKFDYIFSVIPFLWKPFGTKNFIFNPHGNRTKERKERRIGNKLLYLAEWNLKFCDQIMLPSYFLVDQIGFKEKYDKKIFILSDFIDTKQYHYQGHQEEKDKVKILTITSFKFYEKGRGIINLGKVINQLSQSIKKKITWTIIGNNDSEIFKKILGEFSKIEFNKSIEIERKGWVDKKTIIDNLHKNDLFLYRTYLESFGVVLIEAMAAGLPILVNDFECFKYILPSELICKNETDMINKTKKMLLDDNLSDFGKKNVDYVKEYDKYSVLEKLIQQILLRQHNKHEQK